MLSDGQAAYDQKQYKYCIDRLSRFLDEAADKPEAARAYYVRGLANALSGRRREAYADLRQAHDKTDGGEAQWRAAAMLGTLYFEDGDWSSAIRYTSAALTQMPQFPPAAPMDGLLFRLGNCYERNGQWADARRPYGQLVDRFSEGVYVEPARRRLRLSAEAFSIQCGVFGLEKNSANLIEDLKRRGFQPFTTTDVRGKTTLHVVLVGRYRTYEPAAAELARVKGYVPDAVLWP